MSLPGSAGFSLHRAAQAEACAPRWLAIVPCFNHGNSVGAVVSGLVDAGATVLVIDDGSTDAGGESARRAGATVIGWPANRGKGAALRAGLAWAAERGYTFAVTADADGQHPLDAILTIAQAAADEPAALHLGVRDMAGAPWLSRAGRFATAVGGWLVCARWLPDNQTGLRGYPLPASLGLRVVADRFAFEIAHAVLAARSGMTIRHHRVPVLYPDDRISHFRGFRDTVRTVAALAHCLAVRP